MNNCTGRSILFAIVCILSIFHYMWIKFIYRSTIPWHRVNIRFFLFVRMTVVLLLEKKRWYQMFFSYDGYNYLLETSLDSLIQLLGELFWRILYWTLWYYFPKVIHLLQIQKIKNCRPLPIWNSNVFGSHYACSSKCDCISFAECQNLPSRGRRH